MPTSTLSGYDLVNLGPLTTTFTAPASCSTLDIWLGLATDPATFYWVVKCDFIPPADCNPAGSEVQSIYSSALEDGDLFLLYQSPGLVCPAGFATVGGAAKPNPTSTSMSGAFNVSNQDSNDTYRYLFKPVLDVFIEALDPGETAVVCCPSAFSAVDDACISAFASSEYTPTVGCARIATGDIELTSSTWTTGGETITGEVLFISGTTKIVTTTTTLSPSDATALVGVAITPMVILVHQASDTPKANAATAIRGHENSLGVAAVCCLALTLGGLLGGLLVL